MKTEETHIINYLEGNLSKKDRLAFEEKLKISPSLQQEVEDIRFVLLTMDTIKCLNKVNTEDRWKKTSFKLSLLKLKHVFLKSVQVILIALFLPLLVIIYYQREELTQINLLANEIVEVKSAYGLVSKIILPDSTIAYLNSGSSLTYPLSFTKEKRNVSLIGEAYFIVKANPESMFEVKLNDGLSVCAYGTEFNINAYDTQEWISAVLVNGNISINRNNVSDVSSSRILQPGQIAIYDKETENINLSPANLYVATAWKDGKTVFRRAKMSEIVYRLSKHFNVDIELKNKELSDYEFSATFTTESLTEVLNLLMKASPIQWHYVEPEQQKDESFTKRKVIISLKQ